MPPVYSNISQIAVNVALLLLVISASAAWSVIASVYDKVPMHTSKLRGQDWVEELLHGHDGRFYDQMGVHKHVFKHLVEELWQKTDLDDSKNVTIEEQVAIFLHAAVTGQSNRKLQERFQRSGDTISRCAYQSWKIYFVLMLSRTIHRVLHALTSEQFYRAYVRLPTLHTPLAEEIRSDKKFFPYFKDCLGALDGTHILAFTPELD
jgi:hypothetical protein